MIELLKDYKSCKPDIQGSKDKIVETLLSYGVEIASIEAKQSPTVTLYEIVPARGVRIAKIRTLQDDIALCLGTDQIRISVNKGSLGIEVPADDPTIVGLREILETEAWQKTKAALPIAFGRTVEDKPCIIDLAKMPHLLMAGATGQGKSVGINTMIMSLIMKKKPSEVKFIMIDPKQVEMTMFAGLENHYLAKLPSQPAIITDVSDAVFALKAVVKEMENRYQTLKRAGARNIGEYSGYMPYIVVFVDEFADLMLNAGGQVEYPITRIAQLARAVGIHLVIATQRPSVNIITGLIKANFPARVAYRVISAIDSRIILDRTGAERLIGRGDMIISTGKDIVRAQCSFVDTPEISKIVDSIRNTEGEGALILKEKKSLACSVLAEDDPLLRDVQDFLYDFRYYSQDHIMRYFQIDSERMQIIEGQLAIQGTIIKKRFDYVFR